MFRTVPNGTLDQALVVRDPDTGSHGVRWVGQDMLTGKPEAPAFACTVIGFDDPAARDAHLATLLERRDNATACTAHSPERGGPHVVLQVHLDRPTEPDTAYEDAVERAYAGRGRVNGGIEGGDGAWSVQTGSDTIPTGFVHRPHPDGTEVAWHPSRRIDLALEPELGAELSATLRRLGLRLVGDGRVGRAYPGGTFDATSAAGDARGVLDRELVRLDFVSSARATARLLMSDPAVPRMLGRLAEGCLVLWGENVGKGTKLSSYQVRPGNPAPYRVSGEHVRLLGMLGAVERLWEPNGAHRFHGTAFNLVGLTDRGRDLLAGDIERGVSEAVRPGSTGWWRRQLDRPFIETVQAHASGLSDAQRERLLGGMSFPGQCRIRSGPLSGPTPETMNMVLVGLMTGAARVADDGLLKAARPRKPGRASRPDEDAGTPRPGLR